MLNVRILIHTYKMRCLYFTNTKNKIYGINIKYFMNEYPLLLSQK
jgi:hypothetical protein